MVRLQDNVLRMEVGISYQWLINAQQAVVSWFAGQMAGAQAKVRKVRETGNRMGNAFKRGGRNVRVAAVRANQSTRQFVNATPGRLRDRTAAALLGMTVPQVVRLREFAICPPSPASVAATKTRSAKTVKAAALDMPKTGMAVDARTLQDALKQVSGAASKKSSLPILEHALIEPDGIDGIRLTTTDLEIGCSVWIPAMIADFKATTVPVKLLSDNLKGAKGAINLHNHAHDRMMLESKGAVVVLDGLPAEEFPMLPAVEVKQSGIIENLCGMFKTLLPAVATDETRAIITGILLESERACTTDTHRLFITEHEPLDNWQPVIIPARVCDTLARLLGWKYEEGASDISIEASSHQIKFKYRDSVVVSRLIEGNFPNYEQVIPAIADQLGTIDCSVLYLRQALEAVAPTANEDSQRVVWTVDGSGVTLSASSGSCGEVEAAVEAQIDGFGFQMEHEGAFRFAMSCKYALDTLAQLSDCSTVRISGRGAVNQFRIESDQRPGFLAVVMPMQAQ